MRAVVSPGSLDGVIQILPSKSYLHRYLIAAALCDADTEITAKTTADDVMRTKDCLNALGAQITCENGRFFVRPIRGKRLDTKLELDCGESGTTFRFVIPLAAALGANAKIGGKDRLGERPIIDLTNCIRAHGVTVGDGFPIDVSGQLESGEFKIAGNISSQFISGLLLSLPLLNGDSRVIIQGQTVSEDYINITIDVLSKFGVTVEKTDYGYFVRGGQRFISPGKIECESDWSNAAFFLVAGAIRGDLTVTGLNLESKQGDKEILNILAAAGASAKNTDAGYKIISAGKLRPFQIDAQQIPDLVPVVSVLAAYAGGRSVIKNVQRLRDKESDRLAATINLLAAIGVRAETDGINLVVNGAVPSGGLVDGVNDHRIVMSAAVSALGARGQVTVTSAQAVKKSYPQFFEEFARLGGKYEICE
jgi:3-phosphoshikimate 1-carboxyvinyltransferase